MAPAREDARRIRAGGAQKKRPRQGGAGGADASGAKPSAAFPARARRAHFGDGARPWGWDMEQASVPDIFCLAAL